MSTPITSAMVLAAGLGQRLRPLTDSLPKPLVRLAGRPLLDHVLDRLADAGIARAVVNVHYRADQIEAHLAGRRRPTITISDERAALLDTGGGVVKALPLLAGADPGTRPFLIHNSDSAWIESGTSNLARLMATWDDAHMDCLLLLAPVAGSLGYDGRGDFELGGATADDAGRLAPRPEGQTAPFVFAGASIAHPRLFEGAPTGAFSLARLWRRAMTRGRAYGVRLDGLWMHVGDPQALADAEAAIARHAGARGA